MDRPRIEKAIQEFLAALGQSPEHPELRETPARVADAWMNELLTGYAEDPQSLIDLGSMPRHRAAGDVVVVREIPVATLCPHHLLPAIGHGVVAYKPGPRLLGVGTVVKLVNAYARRLTLQETVGQEVVDALQGPGAARGSFCKLILAHSCLTIRGAQAAEATVTTTAAAGEFQTSEGRDALRLALEST